MVVGLELGSRRHTATVVTDARSDGAWRSLRAHMFSDRLDRWIAAGHRADGDGLVATRARQLVSPRERERLACALDAVKVAARTRRSTLTSSVPLDLEAARIASPALTELSRALRVRRRVDARGVAMTQMLLTDPASPLYRPAHPTAALEDVHEALVALGPGERSAASGAQLPRAELNHHEARVEDQ